MGSLVGAAGPVWLFARPCLVRRLLASGWQDKVTRWLAAEPRVVPDLVLTVGQSLVLAQMAAELGFLDLVLACWWVGPAPDMGGSCS